ncbi:FecR family protein [Mucilaginibacter paludis]|uniref:Anti-FecI sigma factor, FecR n=1 Tax=Mucilaginibacter paludis DSM 18603 TaxID=714943 RepID=H1YFZ1_9SPHI|nr:FecR family protein [Mucilaginibacter paludis]EHQ26279.1 anti-FecI sigma factor, FecR [Mucilaginibacter paludis DSM 18603]
MDKTLLKELLQKYESGNCNAEETALLENWYLQWSPNEDLQLSEYLIENSVDKVWNKLEHDSTYVKPVIRAIWPRIAAAVALLIMLSTGAYLYLGKHKELTATEIAAIKPGGNKAILTLANGAQISLADAPKGSVVKQAGVTITKAADGEVTYTSDETANAAIIAYNIITTPKGGQYQLILPDGSHVWLNAASSIRYPTVFTNNERKVEITGEAYFEVAKNAKMPFKVKINDLTEVKVLGTHFNINAYANEPVIQTTLAEGAISISSGSLSDRLSPGQQANIGHSPSGALYLNKVANANIDQVLAWKDGLFSFQDMPFDKAMRQLSRWYDVDVVYQDGVPDTRFAGELGRDVNFSKILFFLSKVNIHYRMERGNRLVIIK